MRVRICNFITALISFFYYSYNVCGTDVNGRYLEVIIKINFFWQTSLEPRGYLEAGRVPSERQIFK